MDPLYEQFISKYTEEQKSIFRDYLEHRSADAKNLILTDTVTGEINSVCRGSGRPQFFDWDRFTAATVIKEGNDWTIFGTASYTHKPGAYPFVIDVLESQNKFEIKIGSWYPWKAKLSDTNAISYRMGSNKIIVRAIKVVSSQVAHCHISGMIAAETTALKSIEDS